VTERRVILRLLVALAGSVALFSVAAPAIAVQHHPTRGFARFADCPLSNPVVEYCIVAHISRGALVLGRKTVPIDKTITLQGGAVEKSEGSLAFIGAEDGNTLSKTLLSVPGGLSGLSTATRFTEATVTLELAGPASGIELNTHNLFDEHGVALRLHVKARLNNPLLGSGCYLGSSSNPLALDLTTGTTSPPLPNKPIKGAVGDLFTEEEGDIVGLAESLFVDNAFASPAVSGCGKGYLAAVDAAIGLPSPAGRNSATLAGRFEIVAAELVKASE
jgi:hypothetical protein